MSWEVPTMRSKTLSSDPGALNPYFSAALFRKNLSRFWPLWAVYAAVWLVCVPLAQFVLLFGDFARYRTVAQMEADSARELLNMGATGGLIMAVGFGCLFAMALFSYLCSPRSVGMFHSFPLRREGLFLTHFLSGAAVFLATGVVTALLTAAVQGAAGVLVWRNLLGTFAAAMGQMFFFYAFAVFCAMFTGQILAIPAFYAILNGLAAGVNFLVQNFAANFFYGYSGGGTPGWVMWLTPIWKISGQLHTESVYDEGLQTWTDIRLLGLSAVGIYTLAGCALAVLGLLVYRARRSETAGDTVTVRCVKPVFRWGVALCSALSLGQLFYELIWRQFNSDRAYSLPAILACMIVTGLVGFYAAEMLLRKSFRVFRSGWRGAAILVAVLILFGVGVSRDFTGVEHRIPAADSVESLTFYIGGQNDCGGTVTDPELIARFGEAHRLLIAEKNTQLARQEERDTADDVFYEYAHISLTYDLKNGGSVERSYSLSYFADEARQGGTAVAALSVLACDPGVQRANLLQDVKDGRIDRFTSGEMYLPAESGSYTTFDGTAAQTVYEALLADIDAGHFGVNQFDSEAWNRDTFVNDVTLFYDSDGTGKRQERINFSFSRNCTALLAALQTVGITDGAHPLTTYEEDGRGGDAEKYAAAAQEDAPQAAEIIGGADGPTSVYVTD